MEELQQRVERLERRLSLHRRAMYVLLVLLAFVGWRVAVEPDEIAARRFVLQDASGREIGDWAASSEPVQAEDGSEDDGEVACLRFRNAEGGVSLLACGAVDPRASSTVLLSSADGARVTLSASDVGSFVRAGRQRSETERRPVRALLFADGDSARVSLATGGPREASLTFDELLLRDDTGHVFARLPPSP